MEDLKELVKIAYKKTKSYAFYDKNLFFIRDKIAQMEGNSPPYLENSLDSIADFIESRDHIVQGSVGVIALPKSVEYLNYSQNNPDKTKSTGESKKTIISNVPEPFRINKIQYYADMSIRYHIIGTLWTMLIGSKIDDSLDDSVYGNRMNKNPRSWSPYLFKPYTVQYSEWRDNALHKVKQSKEDGNDCVFVNIDVQRFFYNIEYKPLRKLIMSRYCHSDLECRLTEIIFEIIDEYNRNFKTKTKLPIGFTPSSIIANLYLDSFDKSIASMVTPDYYGRYVDDILIVKRIVSPETISESGDITLEKLFPYAKGLFYGDDLCVKIDCETLKVKTSEDKIRIVFVSHQYPDTALTALKRTVNELSSEFRLMPKDDPEMDSHFLKILNENSDSIRKPSEIRRLTVNKTLLSAYLGKIKMLCGLVSQSSIDRMRKNVLSLMNNGTLIENHMLWERVVSILVANSDWEDLKKFIKDVCNKIDETRFDDGIDDLVISDDALVRTVRYCLYSELRSALISSSAMCWGRGISKVINDSLGLFPSNTSVMTLFATWNLESLEEFQNLRKGLCVSRMIGRNVKIPIDGFIHQSELTLDDRHEIRLLSVSDSLASDLFKLTEDEIRSYRYRPYLLKHSNLCLYELYSRISEKPTEEHTPGWDIRNLFLESNYCLKSEPESHVPVDILERRDDRRIIRIGAGSLDSVKIALGNTQYPSAEVLNMAIRGEYDRSEKRYMDVSRIFNEACKYESNIVVFPECSIPLDYVSLLANKCTKNRIALVGGIEYILRGEEIHNILVSILPFDNLYGETDAHIIFHWKRHHSPREMEIAQKAGLTYRVGDKIDLIGWKDFWFSPLCCYEATSVEDRTAFKSYLDALMLIEYNRDVHYFNSIVESATRDLHCYCIQCNNSKYGDSRITQPTRSEIMDIVRNKGGIQSNVIIGWIHPKELRKFQLTPWDGDRYKPLPPGLDVNAIRHRHDGMLFEHLMKGE